VNMKAFFVAALSSALDLGIATPEDVLKHATTDLLAEHLPRPLWARLFTACLGAPKVDATLVVETVGVSNLCEHIPSTVIWACIAELGARALGGVIPAKPVDTGPKPLAASTAAGPIASEPTQVSAAPKAPVKPLSIGAPPPPEAKSTPTPAPAKAVSTNIPAPGAAPVTIGIEDVVAELDAEAAPPARARTPTGQRFRQTNTNIGRLAQTNQQQRKSQAAVTPPEVPAAAARPRRGETEIEVEIETDVKSSDDWRTALAVEDEQLVDWSSSEETMTTTEGDAQSRKR